MSAPQALISFNELNAALKAAGETTRLRVLALLAEAELTVSDLTEILRQSQPRISRHLKLLADAGLVERFREGSWAFFRMADRAVAADVARGVLARLDPADPVIVRDRERLAAVRAARAAAAQAYFRAHAAEWDRIRALHVADAAVESAIVEALGEKPFRSLLDLGTGTGRMPSAGSASTCRWRCWPLPARAWSARACAISVCARATSTTSRCRARALTWCWSTRCCTSSTMAPAPSPKPRACCAPAGACWWWTSRRTNSNFCARRRRTAASALRPRPSASGWRRPGSTWWRTARSTPMPAPRARSRCRCGWRAIRACCWRTR